MRGLEVFREHFKGFETNYVIIGGTACTVLFDEVKEPFRSTKDIDMVVILENSNEVFGLKFWEFIKNGQYQSIYQDRDMKRKFYRFERPKNENYPKMIELFSRSPMGLENVEGLHIVPLPIAKDVSSLSAILLNDDYYRFLKKGIKVVNGLSILNTSHLIPFKAKAWCELTDRKLQGEIGLTKSIKKHKRDILLLLSLMVVEQRIDLENQVLKDLYRFVEENKEELSDSKFAEENAYDLLSSIYALKSFSHQ